MKYEILLIIGIAIMVAIFGFAFIKDLRHAFIVPEGYAGLLYHKGRFVNPALMNLRLMQSLSAAQNAGNTLVLGVPGGFVPLNQAKPGRNTEAGEVKEAAGAET
jgi:hypothetical protein